MLSMDSKPVLGLPLTYFVLNLDTQHRDASTVDLWDDTLTIVPKDAGFFELHVLLGLTPVKNSPLLLEVQAGDVDVSHCHCTLKPFASVPVGETLVFYVVLKDTFGNYCVGTAQLVRVEAPNSPQLEVEDLKNGTSRVSMQWTRMGTNKVSAHVTKNGTLHLLKESEVEVTPGLAWAPEWVEDAPRTKWKQMAGVPLAAAFELRDRFGNMTEHVGDAAVCVEGARVTLELPPPRKVDSYAPWKPPPKEHCVLKFELELVKAGTYNVVWTTRSGKASKELVIEPGPPHPYRCRVKGILNMLVPNPNVSQSWTLSCFDAFDNPCVLGASTVKITVEKWPGGKPVSLNLRQNKHIYECTASFTDYGEYHVFAYVDGIKVLGCPFSMTVTEDPREAENQRQAALKEAERLEAERQRLKAEMVQVKNDKEKTAAVLAEGEKKKEDDAEMATLEAKRKELEKARREARVREMAVAALRKVQAEMREKRREKKEKRVGGGFVVKFESRDKGPLSKQDTG